MEEEEQQGQAVQMKGYSCATMTASIGSFKAAMVTLLSDKTTDWNIGKYREIYEIKRVCCVLI